MKQSAHVLFEYCLAKIKDHYDVREAQNLIEILLNDLHDISKMDVMLQNEVSLDSNLLEEQLVRLADKEPIQHITGFADFYGFRFKVSSDVLVPRPETEELVQWVIDDYKNKKVCIWDIGTGSGCIPISLAKNLADASVHSSDVSDPALEVAKKNAQDMNASVRFHNSDILHETPAIDSIDVIVSNPPYIPSSEKLKMNSNVLRYDPHLALFVDDESPLIFYQKIAEVGQKALSIGGSLYFEIHENYGLEVMNVLDKTGYCATELRKDLQGKDRMIKATK